MRSADGQGSKHGPRPAVRDEDGVLEAVRQAIRGIEYGSVLVKIHQGDVVGIETSTKVRFKDTPARS